MIGYERVTKGMNYVIIIVLFIVICLTRVSVT